MRARRDRHRPTSLRVSQLEDRSVPANLNNFLTPYGPTGWEAFSALYGDAGDVAISSFGEVDTYTLDLDPGQTLSVEVDPLSGLRADVVVYDPTNAAVASGSSPAGSAPAFTNAVVVDTAGRYTIQVTGTSNSTGAYQIQAVLNALVESETQDTTQTNDFQFYAEDIGGLVQTQGPAGSTLQAVNLTGNIGNSTGGFFGDGDTDDYYAFNATARQPFTVGLDTFGVSGISLDVTGPSGTLAATTPTNFDQAVTFTPTADGQYYIHVSVPFGGGSSAGSNYLLGLVLNGTMDQEGNDTPGAAQAVPLNGNLRGSLDATDTADWYKFTVPAGPNQTLYLTSFTPNDGANKPDNFLDPDVQVFASNGTVLVAGNPTTDNASNDNKNALVVAAGLAPGDYQIRVRASTLNTNAAAKAGDYIVQLTTAGNPGPVNPLAGGPYTVAEGGTVQLSGSAVDPNGSALNYSWDLNGDGVYGDVVGQNPTVTWAQLNALSPAVNDGPAVFNVRVQVDDGTNPAVTSPATTLTVTNTPPAGVLYIGATGTTTTQTVNEGATGVAVRVASPTTPTAAPTDPSSVDAASLRYSFDVTYNGRTQNYGGSDYSTALTSRTFTVPSPDPTDGTFDPFGDGPGTVTITTHVYDKDGGVSTASAVTVTVRNVNPTATSLTGSLSQSGGTLAVNGATDVSAADAAALRYSFDLNGDGLFNDGAGTGTYAGSLALANGTYTVPASAVPDGANTVTVRARVIDKNGGFTDLGPVTLPVADAPPTGTASNNGPVDEGSPVVVTVSNVSDPSAADTAAGFRYAVDYNGDGTFDFTTAAGQPAGFVFTVPGSYLPDGPATDTVVVRITDQKGGFSDVSTVVGVRNVNPTANVTVPSQVAVGTPVTVAVTGQVDPSAADLNTLRYAYDFNGDGVFDSPAGVTGYATASPSATTQATYQTPGTKTVRVRVYDKDGGFTDTAPQTISVTNTAPVVVAPAGLTVAEGGTQTFAVSASSGSAAVTNAGYQFAFDYDGNGTFDFATPAAGSGTPIRSYTATIPAGLTADGTRPFTIRVRVYDAFGASSDVLVPVTVLNVAPTGTFVASAAAVKFGDPVAFAFNAASDPSPADTAAGLRYSLDLNNDGDFTDAGEVDGGTGPALGSTTFTTAGAHTVRGRVADKDGGFTDYTVTVNVGALPKTAFAAGVDAGNAPLVNLYGPGGTLIRQIQAFDPSFTGGVRVAVADVNGDGTPDVIAGTGPGAVAEVRVFDGASGNLVFSGRPFEDFTGGLFVAAGDLDGDGKAEFAVSPDQGGGPRVLLYRGSGFLQTISFFGIDDANFRGGARVSIADLNADGRADLLVAAGIGGGPRVAGFEGSALLVGKQNRLFADFFAYEPTLRNGVYLAGGDVNGDGIADLISGAGPGGGPRVTVFDGASLLAGRLTPFVSFFTGNDASRGGVRVAAADVDGDGLADVVTGESDGPAVDIFYGKNLKAGVAGDDTALFPFSTPLNGVFVG